MPEDSHQTTMTDRVLGVIEERGVAPKPRWHFLVHESVVWVVAAIALLLGSVATALTLYIAQASFFVEHHLSMSDVGALFAMVPYLWLVLIGLGIFYTIHAIHATRRGYRFHTSWLVGIALGVSIAVGWGIHASGASELMDRYLLSEMPMYQPLSGFKPGLWSNMSEGVIAGVVTEVAADSLTVRALDGKDVTIATTSMTSMPPMLEIREGMPIRVTGTTTRKDTIDTFEASEIRPFRGRRGMSHMGDERGYGAGELPQGKGMHRVAPETEGR